MTMSEIKIVKRIKYAGDVHTALMKLGWDAKTAAAFLDSIPDVDKEDVFEHLDLMKEAFDMAKSNLAPVIRCKDCYYWMKAKVTRSGNLVCPKSGMEIKANDFCSKAEKRRCKYDK